MLNFYFEWTLNRPQMIKTVIIYMNCVHVKVEDSSEA